MACAEELKTQLAESDGVDVEMATVWNNHYVDVIFLMHDALHTDLKAVNNDTLIIASSVIVTLSSITASNLNQWCGMNLLPGFAKMPIKEVCGSASSLARFEKLAAIFKWKYKVVPDTPGFITLRVLSMIINEAAATLAEGTATIEDIDTGMVLGTNYPMGPLKWCDTIGAIHIVNTLSVLHNRTGNKRYLVHPFLQQMATQGATFYSSISQKVS